MKKFNKIIFCFITLLILTSCGTSSNKDDGGITSNTEITDDIVKDDGIVNVTVDRACEALSWDISEYIDKTVRIKGYYYTYDSTEEMDYACVIDKNDGSEEYYFRFEDSKTLVRQGYDNYSPIEIVGYFTVKQNGGNKFIATNIVINDEAINISEYLDEDGYPKLKNELQDYIEYESSGVWRFSDVHDEETYSLHEIDGQFIEHAGTIEVYPRWDENDNLYVRRTVDSKYVLDDQAGLTDDCYYDLSDEHITIYGIIKTDELGYGYIETNHIERGGFHKFSVPIYTNVVEIKDINSNPNKYLGYEFYVRGNLSKVFIDGIDVPCIIDKNGDILLTDIGGGFSSKWHDDKKEYLIKGTYLQSDTLTEKYVFSRGIGIEINEYCNIGTVKNVPRRPNTIISVQDLMTNPENYLNEVIEITGKGTLLTDGAVYNGSALYYHDGIKDRFVRVKTASQNESLHYEPSLSPYASYNLIGSLQKINDEYIFVMSMLQ